MEELLLVQPDETLLEEARAYKKAMIAAGSSMDGTGSLSRMEPEMAGQLPRAAP